MSEGRVRDARGDSRQTAVRDTIFVLTTIYIVKAALLQLESTWTFAGPVSLLAGLGVASWCLRKGGESWSDLGLRRPNSLPKMLLWALAVMVVSTIAGGLLETGVASVLSDHGPGIDPRYQNRFADVPGNLPQYLFWLAVAWIIGGFAEELLFRAMLISRIERILGKVR